MFWSLIKYGINSKVMLFVGVGYLQVVRVINADGQDMGPWGLTGLRNM